MIPALSCENLTVGYVRQPVLRDLTFQVAEGERVALLGPNGAGKSTLLRALTGLQPPWSGRVRLFGADVRRLPAAARARLLAVVPQELRAPAALTVEDLAFLGRTAPLAPWRAPDEADRRIVERALVYTDMNELRDRPLDALSGGERQRAVIAMALAQEPRVIVMDEPTTHLDLNHALEILQLVERLNREQRVTVLMTSHDLNLAAEFCHRLLLLDHGRLAADGARDVVLREDILREVYHCDIRVRRDPQSGSLLVLPARRLADPRTGRNRRVHVVAGGGCAGELLRRLSLAGFRVSCGVLNRQDTDARAAEALGLDVVLEKPFSPIGADALARAAALAAEAEAVLVCEVPFGPGNLVNLELAEQAVRRGARVLIHDRNLELRDYTPGRQALARIRRLLAGGARPWHQISQAMNALG